MGIRSGFGKFGTGTHALTMKRGDPDKPDSKQIMSILDDLHDFSRWRFYPGMLFGDRGKWWGDFGNRPRPHEGVDFCFFLDRKGRERCLEGPERLSAIHDGRLIHEGDDFLGRSLYVDSGIVDGAGRTLLFIYAHIVPDPEISMGSRLCQGDRVGIVTPFIDKKSVPRPHLHISTLWIPKNLGTENLDWKILVKLEQVEFCDPLPFLGDDYETVACTLEGRET